jgi:RNA polymerase sigma factor (sigma-70 family)
MLAENRPAPMIHNAQTGASVARIGEGQRPSINRMILAALPGLHSISRTFGVPLPPGIDSEDLVSEAVLAMASHLERGLPWTIARARGSMADFLRRSGARHGETPLHVTVTGVTVIDDRQASTEAGPEELAIRGEQRRLVQRNAAELSPRDQAILRLASHGASGQRIAQELRVSTRRVRQLKAGVLARLAA